jgi:hypothetical protein
MEFETYEDVIDSYNSGVGVEAGESLTDYIKRNNIKIKEFIKQKGRRPRSLEEIKEFYQMEMTGSGGASNRDNVSLASYDRSKYDPEEIEMYENYKYDMNEQRPGMPIIDIDEFLRLERGQASVDLARGGLAGILGV